MWRRHLIGSVLGAILLASASASHAAAGAPEGGVAFSIIRTGFADPSEALVFAGGRLFHPARINHSAFLVRRGDETFLFDTGLGRNIASQVSADMPWWARPFFGFRRERPVVSQLEGSGLRAPAMIVLSHAHWDHASGLEDFPGTPVLATPEETAYAEAPHPAAVFPSQFLTLRGRWRALSLNGPIFEDFGPSLDLFGDGSVLLVGMPGHTPGGLGMLLRLSDGRRVFLVGDTVWTSRAITRSAPKFLPASLLVDADRRRTQDEVARLARFHARHPDVVIVPSHDGEVQEQLGYFPRWIGGGGH